MACSERTGLGLPLLTKAADQTKRTMPRGGRDAYQMLPESLLAVRNPLVFLDWSTNAYHPLNLGRTLPRGTFTKYYHRDEGLTTDSDL